MTSLAGNRKKQKNVIAPPPGIGTDCIQPVMGINQDLELRDQRYSLLTALLFISRACRARSWPLIAPGFAGRSHILAQAFILGIAANLRNLGFSLSGMRQLSSIYHSTRRNIAHPARNNRPRPANIFRGQMSLRKRGNRTQNVNSGKVPWSARSARQHNMPIRMERLKESAIGSLKSSPSTSTV